MEKVRSGKSIDESEIPVALPIPSNAINDSLTSTKTTKSTKSTVLPKPSTPPRIAKKPTSPKITVETPQMENPPEVVNKSPTTASVEPPLKISNLPSPSNTPQSPAASVPHNESPESSKCLKADQIMELLQARRAAYLKNAKLANDGEFF